MTDKYAVEAAYCFLHQKERVYAYSTIPQQKEEIEYAVAGYVEMMSASLYEEIAGGVPDFLLRHDTFAADMVTAVNRLEALMHP